MKSRRSWRHTPTDPGWPWATTTSRASVDDVIAHFDETLEWFDRVYRPHISVDTETDEPSAVFDFHSVDLSSAHRDRLLLFAEAFLRVLGDRRSPISETVRLGGSGMLMALHSALLWEEQEAVAFAAAGDWSTVDNHARQKYPDADESSIRGLAELEVMLATAGFWTIDAAAVTERAKGLPPLEMSRALWEQLPNVRRRIAKQVPGVRASKANGA